MASKGTEIARAYVTIVPTMEGAQKEITKGLASAGADAGKEAGKKVGEGFASSLKEKVTDAAKWVGSKVGEMAKSAAKAVGAGLAAITTAAVTGITAITKSAVSSFADYEQLVGGVEKIFDQLDTASVIADANDAWKNLNMSANQYLEAINSVGASFSATMGDEKGYETAKRGMQAIADFASGTGKNVDELNQKYQAITRSAGSYQSIADQFSGVLPATSAAFLEQAQAAGLLSTEYTKITEVPIAEYQAAVTGMLEKGVDALGLTGNTANETLNTISGSLAGTKSAWQNFITSLASGEQIEERLADLKTAIFGVEGASNGLFNNLIPVIKSVVKNLGSSIKLILPQLKNLLPDVLASIKDIFDAVMEVLPDSVKLILETIVTMLPSIMTTLVDTIKQLVPTLAAIIPDLITTFTSIMVMLIEALPQIIQPFIDALPTIIPALIDGLSAIITAICVAMPQILQALIDALPTIVGSIMDAVIDNLPIILAAILYLVVSIIAEIPHLIEQIWNSILEIAGKLWNAWIAPALEAVIGFFIGLWDGIVEVFSGAAEWFDTNVIQPIVNFFSGLWEGIKTGATTAWNNVSNAFQSAGNWFSENVLTPVGNFFTSTWESLKTGASNAWSGISNAFSSAGSWISTNVTGPIGTFFSDAWEGIKTGASSLWEGVKSVFQGAIDFVKGLFDFDWEWPKIKLPHFSITGSFDILRWPPQVPSLSVSWYDKAMDKAFMLNGATIFGQKDGQLLGGGESGSEIIVGTQHLLDLITKAVHTPLTATVDDDSLPKQGGNIYITINGAEGQDVESLADEVLERLQSVYEQKEVVYA